MHKAELAKAREQYEFDLKQLSRDRDLLEKGKLDFKKPRDNFELDRAHLLKDMQSQRGKVTLLPSQNCLEILST